MVDLRELAEERPSDKEKLAEFGVGDNVRLMLWITERAAKGPETRRLQPFEGTVIKIKKGLAANFTVRRVQRGFGVDRTSCESQRSQQSLTFTTNRSIISLNDD